MLKHRLLFGKVKCFTDLDIAANSETKSALPPTNLIHMNRF